MCTDRVTGPLHMLELLQYQHLLSLSPPTQKTSTTGWNLSVGGGGADLSWCSGGGRDAAEGWRLSEQVRSVELSLKRAGLSAERTELLF